MRMTFAQALDKPRQLRKAIADAERGNDSGNELPLSDLRSRYRQHLHAAAQTLTLRDFHWIAPGRVTYLLSRGQVPATGPGDLRGIEALIGWLDQHEGEEFDLLFEDEKECRQ